MNGYETLPMGARLLGNSYVGRGIVMGRTRDGSRAAAAYFIMGRSENSRNRVFTEDADQVFTKPFDPSKVEDPSLIIYRAVCTQGNHLIVTNGDQTDTIFTGLEQGKSFSQALRSREFEPDRPNFTPRISAMATFADGGFSYEMSILKSADPEGSACSRFTFFYPALPGVGHFLHTYQCDGNPLPTFQGEPERVVIPDGIDNFAREIWDNLDENNRISLYVRYVSLADGSWESRLINKNK